MRAHHIDLIRSSSGPCGDVQRSCGTELQKAVARGRRKWFCCTEGTAGKVKVPSTGFDDALSSGVQHGNSAFYRSHFRVTHAKTAPEAAESRKTAQPTGISTNVPRYMFFECSTEPVSTQTRTIHVCDQRLRLLVSGLRSEDRCAIQLSFIQNYGKIIPF